MPKAIDQYSTTLRGISDSPGTLRDAPSSSQDGVYEADCPPIVSGYFKIKEIAERVIALFLLIPAFPLLALLVVLIRITSKGPAICGHVRIGKRGRNFTMFKLRSIRTDAEAESEPVRTGEIDPHVTPLGRWLRRFGLDGLPQLVNVILGDMSLIGPRPERPEFVTVLERVIPGYSDRLLVLPGITGLAQITLPRDTGVRGVRRELQLDVEYIEAAGPLLDARIYLWTLLKGLGVSVTPFDRSSQHDDGEIERAMAVRRFERQVFLFDSFRYNTFIPGVLAVGVFGAVVVTVIGIAPWVGFGVAAFILFALTTAAGTVEGLATKNRLTTATVPSASDQKKDAANESDRLQADVLDGRKAQRKFVANRRGGSDE